MNLLASSKNGKDRYRESAIFNRTIQMLVRGADAYEIIDQLITITEDASKALEQYMLRAPIPPRIKID